VVVGWRPFGAALNVYDDEMNELLSFFEPAASNEIREITDAISLNDGGFLCAGIVAYYLDDVIGVDDVQLRLWRLDENAEPMWAFNLPELGWTASPSEILLNPNGEFIVFANRYITTAIALSALARKVTFCRNRNGEQIGPTLIQGLLLSTIRWPTSHHSMYMPRTIRLEM
jgi:hypothetical protein